MIWDKKKKIKGEDEKVVQGQIEEVFQQFIYDIDDLGTSTQTYRGVKPHVGNLTETQEGFINGSIFFEPYTTEEANPSDSYSGFLPVESHNQAIEALRRGIRLDPRAEKDEIRPEPDSDGKHGIWHSSENDPLLIESYSDDEYGEDGFQAHFIIKNVEDLRAGLKAMSERLHQMSDLDQSGELGKILASRKGKHAAMDEEAGRGVDAERALAILGDELRYGGIPDKAALRIMDSALETFTGDASIPRALKLSIAGAGLTDQQTMDLESNFMKRLADAKTGLGDRKNSARASDTVTNGAVANGVGVDGKTPQPVVGK